MQAIRNSVNTLLITDNHDRAKLIQREMERAGVRGALHMVAPHDTAAPQIRRMCSDRSERRPDVVLFDFVDGKRSHRRLLREIGFGSSRLRTPVVTLTSQETEDLLQAGEVDGGKAVMFAPIQLRSFIRKLSDDRRKRFLWSLSVIYDFGPILLRSKECDALGDAALMAQAS